MFEKIKMRYPSCKKQNPFQSDEIEKDYLGHGVYSNAQIEFKYRSGSLFIPITAFVFSEHCKIIIEGVFMISVIDMK